MTKFLSNKGLGQLSTGTADPARRPHPGCGKPPQGSVIFQLYFEKESLQPTQGKQSQHSILGESFPRCLSGKESIHPPMQEPQEMQVQSLGGEDALEKEMATHSRILAQAIAWTEEPGKLQSTGLQSWTRQSTYGLGEKHASPTSPASHRVTPQNIMAKLYMLLLKQIIH